MFDDLVGFALGMVIQLVKLAEAMVGKTMALEMTPDVFHGVEFWGVGWQPLDREPWVHRLPQLNLGTTMGIEPVPDENDVAPKMGQ
jgi:hypothetical protein